MNRYTAKFCVSALASMTALFAAGCQKGDASDSGSTKVVVYDIDRVAKDLGWATDMTTNMDTLKNRFQADLKRSQDMYNQQILDQKKKWAPKDTDKLTPEQTQVLTQMNAYANQVLGTLNQSGSQQFAAYRQQWIVQYHVALRPILAQVAEERKLAIIIEKNEQIQYNLPSADITDSIIDAAKAHPPVINPVPMPELQNPGPMILKMPDTQPSTKPTTAP